MGENLSFENILSEEDIENLFTETPNIDGDTGELKDKENNKEEDKTAEIDLENLFEDESEGVGGEGNLEGGDDDESGEAKEKPSPNTNFYSSIATALRDEGILPDLDDDSLKNITDPEAFADAIEKLIQAKLDEKLKRIDQALNYGVDNSDIKRYENTISYLDSIKEDDISDEGETGESLRRQIIMLDYLNRGFSKERAERETNKSFSSGSDLEDAKEALESNKEFFSKSYQELINEAKEEEEKIVKSLKQLKEELKKSLLESKQVFDGIDLDQKTRLTVWDNLTKPIYKDEDGNYYSAIQKYEKENKTDFMKKLGVLFTLTDGFKSIDKLVGKKVEKEKRKSIRELENTLKSNTAIHGGSLDFMSGVSGDPESNINLVLDV